jgi:hypothetical protein
MFMFMPGSVGAAATDPFLEEPRKRIYQLLTFRPFGPFEWRWYRLLLGVTLLTACALAAAALWRRRRRLSPRAEWAGPIAGIACLVAFLVVPFWMAGGAYFPERFAAFAALFLLGSAGLSAAILNRRARLSLAIGASAGALIVLGAQIRVNHAIERDFRVVLDAPPVLNARLGAVIMEDEFPDSAFLYGPQLWIGAHYIRRSGVALLNSPWLDVPDNWLRVTQRQPCQFLHPVAERPCLDEQASLGTGPPIDILVGVRGTAGGIRPGETERIARLYGLTERLWDTPLTSAYTRPELAAERRGRQPAPDQAID